MRTDDVVVDGAETFKILRSAAEDGRCHFEMVLAPGASGPPAHTHDEPEDCTVVEGAVVFLLDGVERTFSAGDEIVIPPGCVHTFRNASKAVPVRFTGTHSGRFERLIDQLAAGEPTFLRLGLYLTNVDARASYMVSPVVRAVLRGAALVAKLRGVTIAPATGHYGQDPS